MIRKFLVIMTVASCVTENAQGSPHHHNDDPYEPIIRLLKEARREQRRGQQGGSYNPSASNQYPSIQFPSLGGSNSGGSSGGSNSGGSSSGGDTTSTPILTPENNRRPINIGTVGGAISGVIPPAGGPSSNYPPILPNFPSGSQIAGNIGLRPPYPIEQVNRGVSTILNGVRSFDLGQILRGAFVFPRNENVRSVANNVIDSIFGAAKTSPRK